VRILVVHQNFPGQFGYFVSEWARRPGWDVRGLCSPTAPGLPGFEQLTRYSLHRKVQHAQHRYLKQMEAAVLHGQAAVRAMLAMRKGGFVPDVILAHPGWGETLYAKDVFPETRLVHLCEWFYSAEGADLGFDPEFPMSFDDQARIRTWNALHTLNLTQCDLGISPTQWQRSRHPDVFQSKIAVQHEGIALGDLRPNSSATIRIPVGASLKVGDPVITYVARNLEPYRGFHVFMRALEQIQAVHPTCQAVIVGGDDVSYGSRPKDAPNWREHMLRVVSVDPARTHFMGRVPRDEFVRTLQISAAHVYLTYPFVLSWSLLEAMACGAPVIASNTAPVREVVNGASQVQLCDFFDVHEIVEAVLRNLHDPLRARVVPENERHVVAPFDRSKALNRYDELVFPSHSSQFRIAAVENESLASLQKN